MEDQVPYGKQNKWTLANFIKQKGYINTQVCRKIQLSRMTYEKKIENVNLLTVQEVMLLAKHFDLPFIDLAEKIYNEVKLKSQL